MLLYRRLEENQRLPAAPASLSKSWRQVTPAYVGEGVSELKANPRGGHFKAPILSIMATGTRDRQE